MKWKEYFFFSVLIWISALAAALPCRVDADPIEVGHPVYDLLRRGEALGSVPLGFTSTLPKDRSVILHALKALTQGDDAWMREKAAEMSRALDWPSLAKSSRLVLAEGELVGGLSANYFTAGVWQDSLPNPQAYAFGSFALEATGTFREKLFATSQAFLGMERSREARFLETYNPAQGMAYNTNREGKAGKLQGVSTFDGFRTVFGYDESHLRFEIGQDWNTWGPGVFQHATLGPNPWFWVQDSLAASDTVGFPGSLHPGGYRRGFRRPGEASPMPQARFIFTYGPFEYTKVIAERKGLWNDSAAWMVAHRLQWQANRRLSLAATEMVLIGGRMPDFVYLLPMVPIKYAEHQAGDRDNTAIAMDVTALLPGRVRAYGELLLDDFSGFPLSFWGNKYAVTFGASAVNPGLPRTDFHAEYAMVSPWVFTHHRRDTQMQSYGALLGSRLPADAQALNLWAVHHWNLAMDWSLGYDWQQRTVGSRAASPFSVHELDIDGDRSSFLDGPLEHRHQVRWGVTWRWARYLEMQGEMGWLWVSSWRGMEGRDLSTPTLEGHVNLRY